MHIQMIGHKPSAQANPLDPETARAVCAVVLMCLFVTRTVKTFGGAYLKDMNKGNEKPVLKSSLSSFIHFTFDCMLISDLYE